MKLSPFSKSVVLGLAVALLGAAALATPPAQELEENVGLEWLFAWRGPRPVPPDVVVVAMEKTSSDRFNLPNNPARWSRTLHARLIDRLTQAGAAAIGFDVIFDEARAPEADRELAAAIARAGNVVLFQYLKKEILHVGGTTLVKERTVEPLPALAHGAAALASFPLPKWPVRVSKAWTFESAGVDVPTLPVAMFQLHMLSTYDALRVRLQALRPALALPDAKTVRAQRGVVDLIRRLRNLFAADAALAPTLLAQLEHEPNTDERRRLQALVRLYQLGDSVFVNFYGPPRSVTTIPYYKVLDAQDPSALALRGKTVFVGFSETLQPEQKDNFYTVYSQEDGLDVSGVEIAATTFGNLLDGSALRPLTLAWQLLIVLLWGAVLGVLLRLVPVPVAVVGGVGAGALYLAHAFFQFAHASLWLPVAVPLLLQLPFALFGAVLWRYLDTQRERDHIRRAFGCYLPARVVDEIAKNVGSVQASGQLMYGVCLSTDAAQYTALAERMNPRALGALMNDYYAAVFQPVTARGGIVSDVVGDAMLALWASNAPDGKLRHAACLAAREINVAARAFSQARNVALPTRIGLHTGEVLLGNVGARDRYEYRAVGDIVNAACRIQELNKHLGTQVLASSESIAELDPQDDLPARALGSFLLAGKSTPLCVHELLPANAPENSRALCAEFAGALAVFFSRRWDAAHAAFASLRQRFPDDGPTGFYLGVCQQYRRQPPAENWSGVIAVDKSGVTR